MSIRAQFADAIQAALPPDVPVIPAARNLDAISGPVVVLERTTVAKPPNAMGGYLATFVVHIVSPQVDRYTQDDHLDDALDVLLVALDGIDWCHWDTATRSIWADSYPSFQVEVITITDKSEGI